MGTRRLLVALAVAAVLVVLSLLLGRFGAFLVRAVAIAGIGALSLNLLIGYCGQISFAQGALLGVGAYVAGNLGNAGADGVLALLGAGAATAAVGALIGLPALRLRGLYFAIATLAAQAILEYLFKMLEPFTGGVSGLVIRPPAFFGVPVASDQVSAAISVLVLLAVWLALTRLTRTNLGRAFLVVRESEVVAKGMGIDVARTKAWAFAISGFVAGVAGGLIGFAARLASPEAFTLDLSADYIAMIIVGGLGSWAGPLVGAAFVVLLPEAIQRVGEAFDIANLLSALRELAFGLLIILFLIFEPRGLSALLPRLRWTRGGRGRLREAGRGGNRNQGRRRSMKKRILGALLAVGVVAASAAPSRAADVTVCAWGTITGPDALVNGMAYGTRDYFEFLNQTRGGIAGNKVNTLLLDGRYKLDEELKIYRRCVDQENAVYVNGWSTGSVNALKDQIGADGVPFMTDSFASQVLDPEKLPYIFMAGPTYEQQMIIALRDLKQKGGKRVVLMHADNEYGRGPVSVVRQSGIIQKLGLELVDTVEFRYDAQDLTGQLLRVKSRNPDMVYIQSSAPQALVTLRDAAKVGLPARLFIGNMYDISPTIPEQLGPAAEGFRAIQIYAQFGEDIPAMKDIEAFKAKNKVAKEDIYYMKGWLQGTAMAAAIGNAIGKSGGKVPSDLKAFRKLVRDEMEALRGLDTGGITPPLNYADHQGSTQARIAEIKDGKYAVAGEWIDAR